MPKLINEILESNSFCGTILIAKANEIIFEKGYGVANTMSNLPNSTNVVYRIGSLAKQFTALCILQLVEQGFINLDDSINKYIPTSNVFKDITIHQLLVHSSGLPTDFPHSWDIDFCEINLTEALKTIEIDNLQPEKPLYSNIGYSILGHLIELTSNWTYSEYISNYICEPLGLLNTGSDINRYLAINNLSYGYEVGEKSKQMLFKMYEGAGSIFYTTPSDYSKWDKSFYSDVLLSDSFKNLMFKCYEPINEFSGYGYGWEVNRLHSTIHQHSGHIAGTCSFAIRNSNTKFLMFAVSNKGEEGLKPINLINDRIVDLIM